MACCHICCDLWYYQYDRLKNKKFLPHKNFSEICLIFGVLSYLLRPWHNQYDRLKKGNFLPHKNFFGELFDFQVLSYLLQPWYNQYDRFKKKKFFSYKDFFEFFILSLRFCAMEKSVIKQRAIGKILSPLQKNYAQTLAICA